MCPVLHYCVQYAKPLGRVLISDLVHAFTSRYYSTSLGRTFSTPKMFLHEIVTTDLDGFSLANH